MINVRIDEMTPCLKDVKTGDVIETEVIEIKRKSFLSKFHKKNGWYVNWSLLSDENEIYALVIKGTVVQDLLASLGAKFGSALADIFQTEFLRILAERISDGGLTPATDTVLLLTAYRSGSHLTSDIQGLIALQGIADYEAVYVTWMCAAPQNNSIISENKKYLGVGGHLYIHSSFL